MKFGQGIAVVFMLLMLGSIFAGTMPAVAQAAPKTSSVLDEYRTIMAAVNEAQAGDIEPSLDSNGDGISDCDEINGFTWGV